VDHTVIMERSMPVKAENQTLYAYEMLRQKILNQELEPGGKINQVEVAQEIGVSRTPVAKALSRLESEGLVDNASNHGFVVHETTVVELLEFYTVRESLEIIIVNEAIDKATRQQLDELEDLFAPYTGKWTQPSIKAYWLADRMFHNAMVAMCTNKLVIRINNMCQVYYRTFIAGVIRNPEESIKEHKQLIKALREKDINTARVTAIQHTAPTREALQNMVDQLHKIGIDPATVSIRSLRGSPDKDSRLVWV